MTKHVIIIFLLIRTPSLPPSTAYTRYSTMPEDVTPFPWSLNPGDYLERRGTWQLILYLAGKWYLVPGKWQLMLLLAGSALVLLLLVTVSLRCIGSGTYTSTHAPQHKHRAAPFTLPLLPPFPVPLQLTTLLHVP